MAESLPLIAADMAGFVAKALEWWWALNGGEGTKKSRCFKLGITRRQCMLWFEGGVG